jgi:septum site-determining protein MinD
MPTVYAVASGKGGVGKTTTTAALGSVLADAGHRVVAVDCDLGMPNLAPALGVDGAEPTLHEVLAGTATARDALRTSPAGVDVIPGGRDLDSYRDADPAALRTVVDDLGAYDFVLLDTGAGLSHDNVLPLGLADAVLLVSTVDRDALRDAERTREVGARVGGYAAGLVLTRVGAGVDTDVAGELVEAPVLVTVPEDPEAGEALAVGTPLPSFAPRSGAAAAYRALARDLTGEPIPDPEPPADADAADTDPDPDSDPSSASTAESDASPPADGPTIPDAEGGTATPAPADDGDDGDRESPLAGAMAEAEAMAAESPESPAPDPSGPAGETASDDGSPADAGDDAHRGDDGGGEDDEDVHETPLSDVSDGSDADEDDERKGFFGRLFG